METAAQSEDKDIAEELLRFFVDSGEKECFAALLFTCYDLIKPDVALEVSPAAAPEELFAPPTLCWTDHCSDRHEERPAASLLHRARMVRSGNLFAVAAPMRLCSRVLR